MNSKKYFENLQIGDIVYQIDYRPDYLPYPCVKKVKVKSAHINPHASDMVQVKFENTQLDKIFVGKYNTACCYVKNIWYAITEEDVKWVCKKIKQDAVLRYKEQINKLIDKIENILVQDYKVINEDYE